MHFCKVCENMYYIKLGEDLNTLIYYCRNCGHENTEYNHKNISISKTILKNHNITKHNVVNEYTKLDPTLPRVHNVLCINKTCPTNTDEKRKRDILYIRYDSKNLKYMYLCTTCNTHWNNH